MPDSTPKASPLQTLITTIQQEILTSSQKIENEKIITYWKIGKYIKQHILDYSDRTEYGDYVFITLADSLTLNKGLLYRTVQFYETYS